MDNFICLLNLKYYKRVILMLCLVFSVISLYAQRQESLKINANVQESLCSGNGHVVSVKVHGGKAPYTYRWNDGVAGNFRNDLKSGTYICEVQDASGQKVSKSFYFAPSPTPLQLTYQQAKAADGTSSVTLLVSGGVPPYTYFWIGPGIDLNASQKKNKLEGLGKGIYQVVVQDAKQCSANRSVNLK